MAAQVGSGTEATQRFSLILTSPLQRARQTCQLAGFGELGPAFATIWWSGTTVHVRRADHPADLGTAPRLVAVARRLPRRRGRGAGGGARRSGDRRGTGRRWRCGPLRPRPHPPRPDRPLARVAPHRRQALCALHGPRPAPSATSATRPRCSPGNNHIIRSNAVAAEHNRLADEPAGWKQWGPYLSDRAWGTVREDYSPGRRRLELSALRTVSPAGLSLERGWHRRHLRHQPVHVLRAEPSGMAAIRSSRSGCSASPAPRGTHGEDVKECYFYLDSTPTHSYMRMLYKYPHARFPYEDLLADQSRPHPPGPRVRTAGYRDLRRSALFRRARSSMPRSARLDIMIPHRRHQPWARTRRDWCCSPPSGIATAGIGDGTRSGRRSPWHRKRRSPPFAPSTICSAAICSTPRVPMTCCSPTTPPTCEACFNAANPFAPHQGRLQLERSSTTSRARSTPPAPAPRPPRATTGPSKPGETLTIRLRLTAQAEEPPFERADRMFEIRIAEADQF